MWSSVKHPPPPCSRTLQCIPLHLHLLGPVEPSLNMVAGIACSPPCWYKNLMRAQVFRWQHNMSVYPYYKPWLAQVFLCQIILSCCPVVSTKWALPDIDGLLKVVRCHPPSFPSCNSTTSPSPLVLRPLLSALQRRPEGLVPGWRGFRTLLARDSRNQGQAFLVTSVYRISTALMQTLLISSCYLPFCIWGELLSA